MKLNTPQRRKAAELAAQFERLGRRLMLRRKFRPEDNISLSRQEFHVIIAAGESSSLKMSELAGRMGLAVSSLTTLVDKLVKRGLVKRCRTSEDRRVILLALTQRGRGLFQRCEDSRLEMASAMLENLDSREQDAFLALIKKICSDNPGIDQ